MEFNVGDKVVAVWGGMHKGAIGEITSIDKAPFPITVRFADNALIPYNAHELRLIESSCDDTCVVEAVHTTADGKQWKTISRDVPFPVDEPAGEYFEEESGCGEIGVTIVDADGEEFEYCVNCVEDFEFDGETGCVMVRSHTGDVDVFLHPIRYRTTGQLVEVLGLEWGSNE